MSNVNFSPIKLSDVAESWSITKEDYQKGGWEQMVGTYESVAGADGILNKQDLVAADANGDGCLTLEEIKAALQQPPTSSTTGATPNKATGSAPVLDLSTINNNTTFSTKTVDGQLYVTIDGKDYKAKDTTNVFAKAIGITQYTLDANGDGIIGNAGDIKLTGNEDENYTATKIESDGTQTQIAIVTNTTKTASQQATALMTTIMKDGSMKAYNDYVKSLTGNPTTDANKALLKEVTQEMINIYYTTYNKTGETKATKDDQSTKDFLVAINNYQEAMGISPKTTLANIETVVKDKIVTQAELEALFAGTVK